MAETSGFFQAMMDEETGDYDRKYLAKQFSDYFALFIKNGVFGSPTNQLLVGPGSSGLSVVVKAGNAFIDGMWYNNSTDKEIFIVPNYESQVRVDTVRVRMSQITRSIVVDVFTGDSELQRGEDVYDLQLATINVQPFAETLTAANIKDTRPDQSVCGFVTQLMSVQTTADLFAQYQAKFDEWFAGVKGTLGEDAAGNLLLKIEGVEDKIENEIVPALNPLVAKSINIGVRTHLLFDYAFGKGLQQEVIYTTDNLPKVKNLLTGETYNENMPLFYVEYTPTAMNGLGRQTIWGVNDGSKGTLTCLSTIPTQQWYELPEGGGPNVNHDEITELTTYARNIDYHFLSNSVEFKIYRNRKVALKQDDPYYYELTDPYDNGNVVNKIVGLCYFGYYAQDVITVSNTMP